MAAARYRAQLFEPSKRSRPDYFRALCRGEHQRGNARRRSPRRRRAGAALHGANARLAQAARRRPWIAALALFIVIAGKIFVVPSVLEMESFGETDNPGYFLIKAALWIMAFTIIAQAVVDILRPLPADDV